MTTCPHCGCEIETRAPRQRSSAQNRTYHMYVGVLAEHCGYTHDEMHDCIKLKFLGREDLSTGLTVLGSTAKLSVPEMTRLIDDVRIWAHASLGVYLPAPNEAGEIAA